MPANESQKRQTHARIVDAAGELFRERGYKGASIDDIMAAASLTRGAFYAHFGSKEDLFAEVVNTRHDLLGRLRARAASEDADMAAQGEAILRDYVDPRHRDQVGPNCTLTTLAADIARADEDVREDFAALMRSFADEIARGREREHIQPLAILSLVVGGVLLAHGCRGTKMQRTILRQCEAELHTLLRTENQGSN